MGFQRGQKKVGFLGGSSAKNLVKNVYHCRYLSVEVFLKILVFRPKNLLNFGKTRRRRAGRDSDEFEKVSNKRSAGGKVG